MLVVARKLCSGDGVDELAVPEGAGESEGVTYAVEPEMSEVLLSQLLLTALFSGTVV